MICVRGEAQETEAESSPRRVRGIVNINGWDEVVRIDSISSLFILPWCRSTLHGIAFVSELRFSGGPDRLPYYDGSWDYWSWYKSTSATWSNFDFRSKPWTSSTVMWLERRRTTYNLFCYYHEWLDLTIPKCVLERLSSPILQDGLARLCWNMSNLSYALVTCTQRTASGRVIMNRAMEWWSGQNVRGFGRSKPFWPELLKCSIPRLCMTVRWSRLAIGRPRCMVALEKRLVVIYVPLGMLWFKTSSWWSHGKRTRALHGTVFGYSWSHIQVGPVDCGII